MVKTRVPNEPLILKFDPTLQSRSDIALVFEDKVARSLWLLFIATYGTRFRGFEEWCLERAEEIKKQQPSSVEDLERVIGHFPYVFPINDDNSDFFTRLLSAVNGAAPVEFFIDREALGIALAEREAKGNCRHCSGRGWVLVPDGSDQGIQAFCSCVYLVSES